MVLFRLLDPRPDVIFVGYGDRTLLVDPENPEGSETRKKNAEIIARISIIMRQKVTKVHYSIDKPVNIFSLNLLNAGIEAL